MNNVSVVQFFDRARLGQTLLTRIVTRGLCSGCGLCVTLAGAGKVEMRFNREGYLRPVERSELLPEEEETIARHCPGIRVEHAPRDTPGNDAQDDAYHPLWGPLTGIWAGHANDAEMRFRSSSGGAISALAMHLLATRQVDGIAQVAVSAHDPLCNALQISRTRAQVLNAAGSRYSPSAPLAGLADLLTRNETFALIGKPCDIAALRSLMRADDRVARHIPYLISFMCAGIPSQHGTFAVLERLGIAPENVRSFAYRGNGWPGMACAIDHAGRRYEMDYNTSWGTILNRHLQYRCKICPEGTGEFADIVCADGWHGENGYPDFSERAGRSLILARTEKGAALLAEAHGAGRLTIAPLPVEEIGRMQPYQMHRKQSALARSLAARLADGRYPAYRSLDLWKAARYRVPGRGTGGTSTAAPASVLRQFVREFLGAYRRGRKVAEHLPPAEHADHGAENVMRSDVSATDDST